MRMEKWEITYEVAEPSLSFAEPVKFTRGTKEVLYPDTFQKAGVMQSEDNELQRMRTADVRARIVDAVCLTATEPQDGKSPLRKRMEDLWHNRQGKHWEVIVVAVQMPSFDIEVITNHGKEQIVRKLEYYLSKYDDEMCMRANPEIRIKDFMLV